MAAYALSFMAECLAYKFNNIGSPTLGLTLLIKLTGFMDQQYHRLLGNSLVSVFKNCYIFDLQGRALSGAGFGLEPSSAKLYLLVRQNACPKPAWLSLCG